MMDKMEGDAGVDQLGHREYVGGLWDEMGKLQFDFMVSQGLSPEHTMLDIACGALRGGVHHNGAVCGEVSHNDSLRPVLHLELEPKRNTAAAPVAPEAVAASDLPPLIPPLTEIQACPGECSGPRACDWSGP